jgi:DNA-binding MarR family transcriptional regulator
MARHLGSRNLKGTKGSVKKSLRPHLTPLQRAVVVHLARRGESLVSLVSWLKDEADIAISQPALSKLIKRIEARQSETRLHSLHYDLYKDTPYSKPRELTKQERKELIN